MWTSRSSRWDANWSDAQNCITAPTIILHGSDDGLIYPDNAYFACDQLSNAASLDMTMAPGRGHDLLWTAPKLLRRSLHQLLDEAAQ